jgi:DNA-binding IclR family transcriptional regulator
MAKTYKEIGSVLKSGEVLKYLATQKEPVSGPQIAKAVGIPTGTVMDHLYTLGLLGFVRQVGGDGYELGMGLALFWARKKALLESERDKIGRALESIEIKGDD